MNVLILITLAAIIIVVLGIVLEIRSLNKQTEYFYKREALNEDRFKVLFKGFNENTESIQNLRKIKVNRPEYDSLKKSVKQNKIKATIKNESKRKAN